MALDIRILQAAKAYRDGTVAAMSEEDVRGLAELFGVDGSETTPLVTLREELVATYVGQMRAAAYPSAQLATHPDAVGAQPGNPGNDAASLPSPTAPPA